jgi:hypothetical protein
MDLTIELALQPGRFIGWSQETVFIAGLSEAARKTTALMTDDPARAACIYEACIGLAN